MDDMMIILPELPMTEDGTLDIERIDPDTEQCDAIAFAVSYAELCERFVLMMLRDCPSRRVAHLVRYGSWRVQRKNLVRLRKILKRNNS